MANGAFKFKDNSGNVVSFISGSGSNISFSGGTLDLSGMTGLTLGNLTLSGTTQNAQTASFAPSYLLTSSFNTYSSSLATTGSNLFKGDQTISGSIIPAVSASYDLGSVNYPFRHLYLSSASLYVNGTKVLGSTAQELQITTDAGQSFKILESGSDTITLQSADGNITLASSGGGDVIMDPTNGVIGLKGTVTVYTGNKVVSSDGNSIQFGNGIAITGSIVSTVTPLVSGSAQIIYSGLTGIPSGIVSGSSQLTSSYDGRYVLSGSITQTTWDNIASKPSGIASGSSQIDITGTTGYSTFSSSISTSIGSLSSSVATTTSGLSSSIGGLSSSVATTTSGLSSSVGSLSSSVATTTSGLSSSIGNLSSSVATTTSGLSSSIGSLSSSVATTTSGLSSSVATTTLGTKNRVDSIEAKTGSYATTGSNIFQGSQTITGSLYISQDLIVAGSSSIQNISSSIVNISDNIITVNALNPSIRFGGLAVIDSGSSPQVSGSILFDSVENQWIFVHQNQSTVTSSMVIMGPETYNNIGGETHLTLNRLVKSVNDEHIGDTNITDSGTLVSINSNTEVTGTLKVTSTITGTLSGNASTSTSSSYATTATSSSYSTTATSSSYSNTTTSSSYASTATSSSYATNSTSSSYANTTTSSSYASTATSSSYAANATSSSYATTAGSAGSSTSSTTAATASYVAGANVSGNITGNAATATSSSYATTATSSSYATTAGSAGTATTAATASYVAGANVSGTVSNSTQFNSLTYNGGVLATTILYTMVYDGTNNRMGVASASQTATFISGQSMNISGNATTATTAATASYVAGANVSGNISGNAATATSSSYATTAGTANAVAWSNISSTPSVVSGSAQIALSSTTGFGTYINQPLLTTSAVTHAGITNNGSAVLSNNTSINPSGYTNSVVAGAVGTGGWGITTGIGGNSGVNMNWGLGHNGSKFYFGLSNGSAALLTWMEVATNKTITLNGYTTNGFVKFTNSDGTLAVDTNTYLTSYTETSTLANVTSRGATTSTALTFSGGFNDGYITYSLAQINRAAGFVELQYASGGGVKMFGAGATPITFATSGGATFSGAISASNLSGTNTGDQTSVSGNAGTVTNGVYTTGDQTIGGAKTFSSRVSVNGTLAVNTSNDSSTSTGGITFWDAGNTTTSWIGFKNASNSGWGTHGGASATYHTYFVMDTASRGWIFRYASPGGTDFSGTNVASISNTGRFAANNGYQFTFNGTNRGGIYAKTTWFGTGSDYSPSICAEGGLNFNVYVDGSTTKGTTIDTSGHLYPVGNGTQNLGGTSNRWATVYTSDLSLNNGIGDYTIVEGEEKLYLYNNKNNKVYSFVLQEEDPSTATPKKS